ncbi:maleylpyruvate isomerase family mycothiol-dependent enzyme [Streptomyces bohaiensis]|uniref:Maleylpyruvate isomerase family mycothiol-dependent enzyme n=1 Tax=Streptomyces bohaiensis TaxID=1431344 RepID=A0ABX1CBM3_9ACTN|nr:maleylpyruvate isomerase family mycothiol-dependent enzyme [Streptomyces bohaiensis]NJQ16514.1 maleylpyruvate isomerase family mycothiol-dependent enzyme [Streptomyces bohaiensis]
MSTTIDHSAAAYGGIGVAERLGEIRAAHGRLRTAVAGLTEQEAREAIHLPGWTRAHVLIHLADLSQAFARQARYAVKGETVEVYDGGRPTRDRRIEELHGRPLPWLRDQVEEGLTALEDAWQPLGPDGWELPCSYRNSPLFATQLAWWRETELHAVDLTVGHTPDAWSTALSSHVVAFLTARLPQGTTLHAPDTDEKWAAAEAARPGETPARVHGSVRALAAWLSGRPHSTLPTTDADAPLPELHAWP